MHVNNDSEYLKLISILEETVLANSWFACAARCVMRHRKRKSSALRPTGSSKFSAFSDTVLADEETFILMTQEADLAGLPENFVASLQAAAKAKGKSAGDRERRIEMRDEDKLFVYYKAGSGVRISPRNAAGWRAFAVWMFAFFGAMGVVVWATAVADSAGWGDGKMLVFITLPFLLLTAVWVFAMIRYMKARSEIVDVDSLLQLKREQDAKKKRSGQI